MGKYQSLVGIDTTLASLASIEDHLEWVGDVETLNPTPEATDEPG